MSGNMSATAGRDLLDLGYSDVVELDGGMQAWQSSGRTLLPAAELTCRLTASADRPTRRVPAGVDDGQPTVSRPRAR